MANELTITASLTWANSARLVNRPITKQVTVTGTKPIGGLIQTIGTVDETIALVDVGTVGYLLVVNQDGTNYVELGSDGSVYPIKLKAGEFCLLRWNGAAIHAKANTGACDVEFNILPD